jgi:hypothetical protein
MDIIRCLQNTLRKFIWVHYNGHPKDPSHSYMKNCLYGFPCTKNIHKMRGNFILGYHYFFQLALCNNTHETCMKFAFFGVKTMSYHSLLLALYFERWNQTKPNPPYPQSTCHKCTWMWIFIMCPKKIKKPYCPSKGILSLL